MSTKLLSILALVAVIGFAVLVALQVVELNHYKQSPAPAAAVAAPVVQP